MGLLDMDFARNPPVGHLRFAPKPTVVQPIEEIVLQLTRRDLRTRC